MEDSIKYYFKELQCPFTWKIHDIVLDNKISIIDKLFQKNEEVSGHSWINLLLSIATAYELYMNKENSRAHKELEKSIKILENEKNDEFLNKYKEAFQHVVYSVKLFFMSDKVTGTEIEEEMKRIPLYYKLSPEQKAAIICIKANIFAEYGIQGSKHGLNLAREVLKNNPEEAEWSLLVGLLLRRIRHYTWDYNVTDEELHCMENAYKKNRTSPNSVFLAETYLDFAKSVRFNTNFVIHGKRRFHLNEEYNNKSYNLYRQALNLNENNECVHIKIRCINGLLKLIQFNVRKEEMHMKYEDLREVFSAVNQCLEAAPDNIACKLVASKMYFELNDVRFLIFTQTKVDICFLVYNEVKLTVDGKKYRNEDERKQLEEALEIFQLYPYVENMEVQKDLKEKLQNSKK